VWREAPSDFIKNLFIGRTAFDRQKRLAYGQALSVVQGLRSTNDVHTEGGTSDITSFYELYWGSLIIVESHEVESFMVDIGKELTQWIKSGKKPTGFNGAVDKLVGQLGKETRQ
jgi:hypothetical protein